MAKFRERGGRGRAVVIVVLALGVAYAPVAMTELWPYARPGAPAVGEWLLGRVVSPEYVREALETRIGPYGRSLLPLIVHSVLGGLLMLLGPLQLVTAVRRRVRPHRAAGFLFALTVYAAMAAAAVYLVRTPPADAFSGAAFWVALTAILVGTVLSVTLGILTALAGLPALHQRWMLLCYGFLMTAPLLRLEWGVLPLLLPGVPMEEVNRIATMHLGSLVVLGALVASRALEGRAGAAGLGAPRGTWVPGPLLVVAHLLGAAGLVAIGRVLSESGAPGRRLLAGYLVPYLLTHALMVLRHRRAGREGRAGAREEWRLHLTALCLAPVFSCAAALLLEGPVGLDRTTAWAAGAGIGCGVLAVTATWVLSLRVLSERRRERCGAAAPGAVPGPVAADPGAPASVA
ncbi:DUF2306 domain-containing protein [Streptomyces sp. NPDC097619]|uniref:DUF2306 domain-containing protein n=1 Tax=Streptomyces sp. NPDC097619 TaxID=3157228 RepID=UPI0033278774